MLLFYFHRVTRYSFFLLHRVTRYFLFCFTGLHRVIFTVLLCVSFYNFIVLLFYFHRVSRCLLWVTLCLLWVTRCNFIVAPSYTVFSFLFHRVTILFSPGLTVYITGLHGVFFNCTELHGIFFFVSPGDTV